MLLYWQRRVFGEDAHTWVGAGGKEAAVDVLLSDHQYGALRAALHQLQKQADIVSELRT